MLSLESKNLIERSAANHLLELSRGEWDVDYDILAEKWTAGNKGCCALGAVLIDLDKESTGNVTEALCKTLGLTNLEFHSFLDGWDGREQFAPDPSSSLFAVYSFAGALAQRLIGK